MVFLQQILMDKLLGLYVFAAVGWCIALFFFIRFIKVMKEKQYDDNDAVLDSFQIAIKGKREVVVLYNASSQEETKQMQKIFAAVLCQKMWQSRLVQANATEAHFEDSTVVKLRQCCSKPESGDFFIIAEESVAVNYLKEDAEMWTI